MRVSVGVLSQDRKAGKALRRLFSTLKELECGLNNLAFAGGSYEGIIVSFRDEHYGPEAPYVKEGYYHVATTFGKNGPSFMPSDDRDLLKHFADGLAELLPSAFQDSEDKSMVLDQITLWRESHGI